MGKTHPFDENSCPRSQEALTAARLGALELGMALGTFGWVGMPVVVYLVIPGSSSYPKMLFH